MERAPKQEQEPAAETVSEVGPNVLRMQLPIRMPGLGHVNCYALLDEDGAAIVDPGVPGPSSWRALTHRLRGAGLRIRDVHTVIVTHSHPDHFGGAGRLAQEAQAELVSHASFRTWSTGSDSEPCTNDSPGGRGDETGGDGDEKSPESSGPNPWGEPVPWGGRKFKPPWRQRLAFRIMRTRLVPGFVSPRPTRRVRDGDVLRLAGREWVAVHSPGHTLDHICLYDPERNVLLSGDHVLPTITPHVAGIGSGRDPLADFVASLDKVAALGEVTDVLPAHGHPFGDLTGRIAAIKAHHVERLDRVRAIAAALGPATVSDFSHELFRRDRWGHMAESETYAHLEHLRLAGEAHRYEGSDGLVYVIESEAHSSTPA
ncbi:MAG TPA: MBL fold metallo-hydrolase [Acidimicrobiales bacterium]|jgi:glyoxylase-like metal-dependent hydrolase (beta-lactamase superfamily II)